MLVKIKLGPDYFNYPKFKNKFCSDAAQSLLASDYQTKYPNFPEQHINFFIKRINLLLVNEFKDHDATYIYNIYSLISKVIRGELSPDERTTYGWKPGFVALEQYSNIEENFIVQQLEKAYCSAVPSVEAARDYIPLLKELFKDRSMLILNYVYDFLKSLQDLGHFSNHQAFVLKNLHESTNEIIIEVNQSNALSSEESYNDSYHLDTLKRSFDK